MIQIVQKQPADIAALSAAGLTRSCQTLRSTITLAVRLLVRRLECTFEVTQHFWQQRC